jgi:hypothetical protein
VRVEKGTGKGVRGGVFLHAPVRIKKGTGKGVRGRVFLHAPMRVNKALEGVKAGGMRGTGE